MQTITRIDGSDLDVSSLLYGLVHDGLPSKEVELCEKPTVSKEVKLENNKKCGNKTQIKEVVVGHLDKVIEDDLQEGSVEVELKPSKKSSLEDKRKDLVELSKARRSRQAKVEVQLKEETLKDKVEEVVVQEKPKEEVKVESVEKVGDVQQLSLMEYVTSHQGVSLEELNKLYDKREIQQHLTKGLLFKSKGCIFS